MANNPLSSILLAKRSLSTQLQYTSSSTSTASSETGSTGTETTQDSPNNTLSYRFDPNNSKYLAKLPCKNSYKLLETLSNHVEGVTCLALCGEFVLSASQGKDIIVWQQPDLRPFTRFGTGEGSVKALVTVGNKVFTAHQDSRIRVWKVSTRAENVFRLVETLPTTKDYIGKFMKQSNYVQIRRHCKKLWIEHVDSISCLTFENGLIYSGSWDKTVKIWRLKDLRCLESIKAHDDAINGLVAKNGKLFSASADGKIKVWVKESKKGSSLKLEGVLEGHKDISINAIVLHEGTGCDRVYGGGSDGYLMGWERKEIEIKNEAEFENTDEKKDKRVEWKLVVEVKAHEMAILCLSLMGDILCSGSSDKTICLWKRDVIKGGLRGISKIGVIRGHEGPIKCMQVSPNCVGDGYLLYSGSLDKSLKVWWVSKDINQDEDGIILS